MLANKEKVLVVILISVILVVSNCAPNNDRFAEDRPAGFWAGIWHGLICWITFFISLFTDSVAVYEVHNNGGWYNFGFLLGATIILSGSGGAGKSCKRKKSWKEKEWEEIGVKVEEKVRSGIKSWLDESEHKDKEWEDIGKKIEEKIKRELRKWAAK